MSQQRFRRLTDLFVDGVAIPVADGTHLWLQALNNFERDECISDAQVARARFIMAMREHGDERAKIETRMEIVGRDQFVADLAAAKTDAKYQTIASRLEDDPEWTEKIGIIRRTDFTNNSSATPEERELVDKLLTEWSEELNKRIDDELEYLKQHYASVPDEELLHDYLEAYMERRGDDIANAEYMLTELWYGARYCDAIAADDSALDHSACNGHEERVFASKADVKAAPERLQKVLREGLQKLAMSLRDPKGSGSPQSSSDSSPAPSAPAA
jgi:hypothetical protein